MFCIWDSNWNMIYLWRCKCRMLARSGNHVLIVLFLSAKKRINQEFTKLNPSFFISKSVAHSEYKTWMVLNNSKIWKQKNNLNLGSTKKSKTLHVCTFCSCAILNALWMWRSYQTMVFWWILNSGSESWIFTQCHVPGGRCPYIYTYDYVHNFTTFVQY